MDTISRPPGNPPGHARWLLGWIIVMVVFATVDIVWIASVVLPMYEEKLGAAMSGVLDPFAAVAFYIIFTAGITFYGLAPGSDRSLAERAARSGLYGFFTYSTYALTFKVVIGSSWALALSDIAWGTFVCPVTTMIAALILRFLPSPSPAEA